jgi:PAS domain S-box-containing protein
MHQSLRGLGHPELSADLSSRLRWGAAVTLAVGTAYFLAARLGLFLLSKPDDVAVFWPAAGVSSGVIIAFGRNTRWPVAIGTIIATIAANLTSDRTIWGSITFGLCNAGEAVFTAWLIERLGGTDFSLDRVRYVLWLLAAAGIGTAASGVGAAVGYKLFQSPDVPMLVTWQHWFTSDAIGIITVAPLIIGLASLVRRPSPLREIAEGVSALFLIAVATAAIILWLPNIWWGMVTPVELLFPMLLWLSARCRPAFTSAAIFIICLTIVVAVTFRLGQFGTISPDDKYVLSGAQAAILGAAIFAYVLAALFAERRQHEAVIVASENRVRAIVNTVADAIITIDDRGVIETVNPAAAALFGYSAEEIIGHNVKILMPEPYRLEHDGYLNNYLTTGRTKIIGIGREVVGQRKDGSVFPIELAVSEMLVSGRRMFAGAVHDLSNRKQAEERQRILVAELDHRVKNILAQVAAVAASTRQGSRSFDEFLGSLNGRLQSMAAAHGLLSKEAWQGVGLATLVKSQVAPYSSGTNVKLSGVDLILPAAETQALAMVLHELITNAAKYGALSTPGGEISASWNQRTNGNGASLMFEWREHGGPDVASESPTGYGTNLIRELVPHELGGVVNLVFAPEGLRCTIEIPLE